MVKTFRSITRQGGKNVLSPDDSATAAPVELFSLADLGGKLQELVLHGISRGCELQEDGAAAVHLKLTSLQVTLNGKPLFHTEYSVDDQRKPQDGAAVANGAEVEELNLELKFHDDSGQSERGAAPPRVRSPNFPDQRKEGANPEDEVGTGEALSFGNGNKSHNPNESQSREVSLICSALVSRRKVSVESPRQVVAATTAPQKGVQAIPRYLIRPGSPMSTKYDIPVAWPPMTDYKGAIIFVDAEAFPSATCNSFVLLKDGKNNIGLALAESHEVADSLTQDSHLLLQLIRHKSWLMDRTIIIIANSDAGALEAGYNPSTATYEWSFSSLEDFIKSQLSHFKHLQICRCPELTEYLKSLLFYP